MAGRGKRERDRCYLAEELPFGVLLDFVALGVSLFDYLSLAGFIPK